MAELRAHVLTTRRIAMISFALAAPLATGVPCFGWRQAGLGVDQAERTLYDLLQVGRYHEARSLVDRVAARPAAGADCERLASMRARFVLEVQDWGRARDMARECDGVLPHRLWYAVGLVAARNGGPNGEPAALALAHVAAARLEDAAARAGAGPRGSIELEWLAVRAAIAAAQEERDELALLLEHGIGLEAGAAADQLPEPAIPMRELAGDLWLSVDRDLDAKREYTAALARRPERARSLLGLARAAARSGDAALATDAYRLLVARWTHADPGRPELREALAYLGFTAGRGTSAHR
jgi:hypothetical protein